MDDNQAPRDLRQHTNPVGQEKKVYQKPSFRYERVFETLALACGKIASTTSTCTFSKKTS
jgi:hypothetical protein